MTYVYLALFDSEIDTIVNLRKKAYAKHKRPMKIEREPLDDHADADLFYTKDSAGKINASIRVVFKDNWECVFDRLVVTGKEAHDARQSLFKEAYLTALNTVQKYVVITTVPPLDKLFESFGFVSEGEVHCDWFGGPQIQMRLDLTGHPEELKSINPEMHEYIFGKVM